MSSETSTEPSPLVHQRDVGAFEPWQLFTLAGLIGATIAVFMARGESASAVILISLTIFAAAGVGIAALRTFLPLTRKSPVEGTQVMGGQTRVALEREKALALRSIKELEFDKAMGKVSDKDFADMSGRLRARATRLMRQLDAGTGYRSEIERELEKRIGALPAAAREQQQSPAPDSSTGPLVEPLVESVRIVTECSSCGQQNDADARFCKHCGHTMEPRP